MERCRGSPAAGGWPCASSPTTGSPCSAPGSSSSSCSSALPDRSSTTPIRPLTQPLNADLHRSRQSAGGHAGILGTDEHGFDELGRIMAGGQTALEIGFFAALISIVIGTLYGAVAGLFGRLVDGFMMRFVDIVYSIPFLFIVLVLATKFSATVLEESLLLGFFSGWCHRG